VRLAKLGCKETSERMVGLPGIREWDALEEDEWAGGDR
jgi:hypothetical protein